MDIELKNKVDSLNLKAVLFDMDGVLFDSMKFHSKAWVYAMNSLGVPFTEYDAYMREGMTGAGTISEIFKERLGRQATEDECERIYKIKSEYFDSLGVAPVIDGIELVLKKVKDCGLDIFLVTGSGQKSLLEKLNRNFKGYFSKEKMITAYDVKYGKPNPEPYLKALEKGMLKPNEAIVVENAPLGVKAGHSAGIFTVAVNTGILRDEELTKNGADVLFHNMYELSDFIPNIIKTKK